MTPTVVPLLRLDTEGEGSGRLWGRHVRVRNGGAINEPDPTTNGLRVGPIADAQPNAEGDFLFAQGRGGGRMDKVVLADPEFRWRYVQASHFGEVNSYFHLDRIAAYIDELLRELRAPSLPQVVAVVNAHHAAAPTNGVRDGVQRGERWLPFQGGHYRLPGRRYDVFEHEPISPHGEIHLGPGRQLLQHGALVEAAGDRYRANASHNAAIVYHEYGHHIARHTADFRANALRPTRRQNNRKAALEEGFCDYWAATMIATPHIWSWHHRHDVQVVHPRSLSSSRTMGDYDSSPTADPHANGTIWAAALWELRTHLAATEPDGARRADLLALKTLLEIGPVVGDRCGATITSIRRVRENYSGGLAALLRADELLNGGRHHRVIAASFSTRGIQPEPGETR